MRRRLGRGVVLSYAAALLLPGPGLWLRRAHSLSLGASGHLTLTTAPLLLSLVLFSAGLQVPLRALGTLLRCPIPLLAGLVLHLAIPLLAIPAVTFLLRRTPDTDGGSGLVTAMILIAAMPVAAGATVWTGKGGGDQPTMVGLVLASTLLSPLTIPLVTSALVPLLGGGYADALTRALHAGGGFALVGVALPCTAGLVCRLALPAPRLRRLLGIGVPLALVGSFLLTYVNACGALGSFLAHPRRLLLAAAPAVAASVCLLSFTVGRGGERLPAVVHGRPRSRASAGTGPSRGVVPHARLRHEQQQRERGPDHHHASRQTTPAPAGPGLRPAAEDGRRTGGTRTAIRWPRLAPDGSRPLTSGLTGRQPHSRSARTSAGRSTAVPPDRPPSAPGTTG
ncbi:hypothetical protein ACFCWG_20840 [Streptomyces sp. NPDC056390]|uniref:hypothetical protein n=1 Tax=Streptomyces sp. NPDC056390 TaxID=3345806 RepID=UPI0035E30606